MFGLVLAVLYWFYLVCRLVICTRTYYSPGVFSLLVLSGTRSAGVYWCLNVGSADDVLRCLTAVMLMDVFCCLNVVALVFFVTLTVR